MYKYIVKQQKIMELSNNKVIEKDKVFICIKNEYTNLLIPHPVTNFLTDQYERRSLSIKTIKNHANHLVGFLNYLLHNHNQDKYLDKGLNELELKHGAEYITYLTKKVKIENKSSQLVYSTENVLIKFYEWLTKRGIIQMDFKFENYAYYKGYKQKRVSPFNSFLLGTQYPRNNKVVNVNRLKDFGDGRIDLVNLFIKVAQLIAPEIAFGIALQFYGGLRRGEVINLIRSSVREPNLNGTGEFLVEIADNQNLLFPNKKNTDWEQVKSPRLQLIFKVPIVMDTYNNHKKYLKQLKIKNKLLNAEALFISPYSGKPITGMGYWERFNKIKNEFLEEVLKYDEESYLLLNSRPWSTHIGRGVFTNIIVFMLNWSAEELRIIRGDKNIQSSKEYIEVFNVHKKTELAIEKLAVASTIPHLKKISELRDVVYDEDAEI